MSTLSGVRTGWERRARRILVGALLVLLPLAAALLAAPLLRANLINLQTLRTLQPALLANPQPALSDYAAAQAGVQGAASADAAAALTAARTVREAALRSALARGDVDTAAQVAATLEPLPCDLALHMASSLLLRRDEPGALRYWAMCGGIVDWLNQQGDRALDAGDTATALLWYERGAALPVGKHDTSLALLRLARLLEDEEGLQAARRVYDRYRDLVQRQVLPPLAFDMRTARDTDMWEFIAVGHMYRELRSDCVTAAFWYDLAARRAPESEFGPLYQGICAVESAEKQAYFQKTIRLNPASDRGYYWMGVTLERDGDCTAALPWYLDALARDAQVVSTHLGLARCYEQEGAAESAAAEYRAVLALEPGHKGAQDALERLEGAP